MRKIRIGPARSISEGTARKFAFVRDGRTVEGFVARFQRKLVAYENACRHLPVSLDYGDGRFFTQDGHHFVCQTHGAKYEPLTGLCIHGPCLGAPLKALRVSVSRGQIWLEV